MAINPKMRVQWWLAELDRYGNPTLIDGAHSERSGADQAAALYRMLHLADEERAQRFAVARVELFEPELDASRVNREAAAALAPQIDALRASQRAAKVRS